MEHLSSGIDGQYFTPVEVAHLLKKEPRTVRGWLRDPNHPLAGTKVGNSWLVSRTSLANYLKGES